MTTFDYYTIIEILKKAKTGVLKDSHIQVLGKNVQTIMVIEILIYNKILMKLFLIWQHKSQVAYSICYYFKMVTHFRIEQIHQFNLGYLMITSTFSMTWPSQSLA